MKADMGVFEPRQASVLPWQQPLIEQLLSLKSEQRLPHAILIEMRTAVDSQPFGWQLASALLCESTEADRPCGNCPACGAMQSNNYPDFSYTTLVENERTHKMNKDIKIDQIRRLIHLMSLTSSLQAGKIALIYPAEKLNQSSANALLKTLEEPSAGSLLILLTHNAGRLPVTIRSRCQKWVVKNPPMDTAKTWLATKGLSASEADDYLELSHHDAQLARQLHTQDFKLQYDRFNELLEKLRQDQIDVVSMAQGLKKHSPDVLRLILRLAVRKMIPDLLGQPLTGALQGRLKSILDQLEVQERLLSIEDNNLNLQLQLEDVLISLKRITQ